MLVTSKGKYLKIACAMALAAVLFWGQANQVRAADAITVGIGSSTLSDYAAAMSAAADAAKTALGSKTAAVVIAWVKNGQENAFSALSTKFSSGAKIYGIPADSIFSQDGRGKTALVVAFAGEINSQHIVIPITDNSSTGYTKLGTALGDSCKAIQTKTTDSKLFIVIGFQNNPLDNNVVSGFLSSYGNNGAWMCGGSSPNVFAGGQVFSSSVAAIALYGSFDCRFGLEQGGNTTVSQTALNDANDPAKKPNFSFIFDCISRYESLGATGVATEFNQMQSTIGSGVPFVGGYFLGEIGKKNLTTTASGTGGAISVVNFYFRQGTSLRNDQNIFTAGQNHLISPVGVSSAYYRLNGTQISGNIKQSAGVIVSKHGDINSLSGACLFKMK